MSYYKNWQSKAAFDETKIEVVAEIGSAKVGGTTEFRVSVIRYDGGAPKISVMKYGNNKPINSKLGWLDASVALEVATLIQTAAYYVEALPQPKVKAVKVDPKVAAAKAKAEAALAKMPKRAKRFAVGS